MKSSTGLLVVLVPLMTGVLSTGCATSHGLRMSAEKPPIDRSVYSTKLKAKQFSKVMVIPPSGTIRGAFDNQILVFEREFLRNSVTVISGAITGRVVYDSKSAPEEKKMGSGVDLSDMERALIMAKDTGAEVILQLGEFKWRPEEFTRFFVADGNVDGDFREVSLAEFKSRTGIGLQFESPVLGFTGRFVDVSNGEVLASLDVALPANYCLPEDYMNTYNYDGSQVFPVGRPSFFYASTYAELVGNIAVAKWFKPWLIAAQARAENVIIGYVAGRLKGQ